MSAEAPSSCLNLDVFVRGWSLCGAGDQQLLEEGRLLRRDIVVAGIGLSEEDAVVSVQVVGGGVHMEPLAVRVDQVLGVVAGADGDAGDIRRSAQEAEHSGIGAAGCFYLFGVLGEGAGHARRPASVVGQQAVSASDKM